jgi:hypothetical protein
MKALREKLQGKQKEELRDSIVLSFPEDPEEAVDFQNRRADNLPLELKGITLWSIRQDFIQSSYTILGIGGVWVPVEYINNQWYYTYWSPEERTFWTTKKDLVENLNKQGLGTLAKPYQSKEAKRKDTSSEGDTNIDDQSESSRERTPILQRYGVDQSEYSLHTETQLLPELEAITRQLKTIDISPQQRLNEALDQLIMATMTSTEERTTDVTFQSLQEGSSIQTTFAPILVPDPAHGSGGGGGGGGNPPGGGGGPPGGGGSPPGLQPMAAVMQQAAQGGGGLDRHPPDIFNGNRKNTESFMYDFTVWAWINSHKRVMARPLSRVALAITYIRGDRVREWTKAQIRAANDRVTQGMDVDNDQYWIRFKNDFISTWKNDSLLEDAQFKLSALSMKKDMPLHEYISTLNALITELG